MIKHVTVLPALGWLVIVTWLLVTHASAADFLVEAPKNIPLIADVDVVVVGGSSGAVAAACAAAEDGASVFLIAPRPYLGDDLASTLRLWLDDDEANRPRPPSPNAAPSSTEPVSLSECLLAEIFGDRRVTTPLRIKAAMDQALLDSSVGYLTGCYATDVLYDQHGQIAGVVMANRSGRQAVRARVVVDATDHALVAHLADAPLRAFRPGVKTFSHIVIGGPLQDHPSMRGETLEVTFSTTVNGQALALPVHRYAIDIELPSARPEAFYEAEQLARDWTMVQGVERFSESLTYLPSNTIIGRRRAEQWPDMDAMELDAFRPRGLPRLYVLSSHADVSPAVGKMLSCPTKRIVWGERIGRQAARDVRQITEAGVVALPQNAPATEETLCVGENLEGLRPLHRGAVAAGSRKLPVLARYDVVVVGGGTSGAPAAIAAAGAGAETLVIEALHELGGVGTAGLIAAYWYGLRRGFTKMMDDQVNPGSDRWNAVEKAEWLRVELRRRGADIWFGTLACGVLLEDGQVRGVVVATPWGRGAVLAATVIDATGNADVATWAGAPTAYSLSEPGSLNVQIAGFPERPLSRWYVNTCYTMVDDTDALDVWHLMVWRRLESRKQSVFDVGQLIDSRDRRRIVGDYTLTVEDILNRRTFPDTFSQHRSNFDAAAFPDAPLLLIADAKGTVFQTDVPYRCLLPRGLDGLLVVGLGCSAQRDAMTLIRMQPDLQNQGYAAGLAAAEAARQGGSVRRVDVRALQRQLIQEGLLEPRVHTDEDSYPMSDEAIQQAVQTLADPGVGHEKLLTALAVIVAHRDRAIPHLTAAYQAAAAMEARLPYAHVLGVLGVPEGAATLIEVIQSHNRWDPGVPLTSQRKTGNTFSPLDRLVIALGLSGTPDALPPLIAKLEQLQPDSELSHYKAIALALSMHLPCPKAVDPLVRLLQQPGFTGHATVGPVVSGAGRSGPPIPVAPRLVTVDDERAANRMNMNKAYKELIIAALLYHCGDRDGMAHAILQCYAQDIHGHLARFAREALSGTANGASGAANECALPLGEEAVSAGMVEDRNAKAKLTIRKPYGFRSANAIEIALDHQLGALPGA